jgi:hypothetical protein
MPHIFGKILIKDVMLFSNLASIGSIHKKLWASKVAGIPILGILGLLTWES